MFVQEIRNNSQCSSSGKSLARCNSSTVHIFVIPAEKTLSSSLVEDLVSIDRRVFLVKRVVSCDFALSSSDNWENIGLSIVRPVSTDSKIDLLFESIRLVPS